MEEPGGTYFLCITLKRPARLDLTTPAIAPIIVDALRFYDARHYDLYDYTVMPDHIHMIARPLGDGAGVERLRHILRNLKRWLTRQIAHGSLGCNDIWQDEAYDHIIRNRHDYEEKALYIFQNPQAAGLVDNPLDWPWWGRGFGE
jgi:REP element-mobilizing transposase RayT